MLSNLTPAAARALESAQRRARHEGTTEVQPPHLLHALLEEPEGRPFVLLTRAGVNLGPAPVSPAGRGGPEVDDPSIPLPCSSTLEPILRMARALAAERSPERTVASELLLLALLRGDEPSRRWLESHGLDLPRLETLLQPAPIARLALDEPLHLSDLAEEMETARIIDASANRAREALRVIEDYCRFVLDDAFLSRELKQLRHELAGTLAALPADLLLQSRETLRDVGTSISTVREQERGSLLAVVQANLKRLQEALRSLEEFGKRLPCQGLAHLGPTFEQLRYRGYTLERAILLGTSARQRLRNARLMVLLTGATCAAALDWTIQQAAAGGASIIQLREKELDDRRLLERARDVRRWTRQAGVLFILNDRPDIARLAGADGVHLGQDDLTVKDARRLVGPEMLIGVSTHNLEQVRQAVLDGASYLGVGPTFPSGTKEFAALAGVEFVRQARAETSLPAFVIGGINADTIAAAAAAGARRVAVSQAVAQADDPRAAAAVLLQGLPPPTDLEK